MQAIPIALIALQNAQDEVLLLKRESDVHCPDVWSFPGGKVEQDEEVLEAAKRELKEEAGLTASHWQFIGTHAHGYKDKNLVFSLFVCQTKQSEVHAESEYLWCPIHQLQAMAMPEANHMLVQMLLRFIQQQS
jgi:8-oxo-dGTP diphosphatase